MERLRFKRGNGITAMEHAVSTNTGTRPTDLPVFVTCNAAQGYYELVIGKDGTAKLFDGPTARQVDNFCFQSL